MSHFTVLVVTKTADDLDAALQPFHECTGAEDQYVIDVDITAEARETFAKDTTDCVRGPDGQLHSFFTPEGEWDTRFSQPKRNAEKWESDRREQYVPPGYAEVTVPTSEVEDFATWAVGYYGAEARGEGEHVQIVKRTNPNKQWDWWTLGGRWRGMLRVKAGRKGTTGDPGTFEALGMDKRDRPGVDQARKGDLDIEAMRLDAVAQRRSAVREAYQKVKENEAKVMVHFGHITDTEVTALWQEFTALYADLQAQHKALTGVPHFWQWVKDGGSPRMAQLLEMHVEGIGHFGFDGANVPLDEADPFAWADRAPPLATFAFLGLDGVWRERGEMGWWGMVANEKDRRAWEDELARAVADLPDDVVLSLVDCHI